MNVQSFCGSVILVHGCLTRTRIGSGGVGRIRFCGCMGNVSSKLLVVFIAKVSIFTAGAGKSVLACVYISSVVTVLTLIVAPP